MLRGWEIPAISVNAYPCEYQWKGIQEKEQDK